jgi:hypothetical protein
MAEEDDIGDLPDKLKVSEKFLETTAANSYRDRNKRRMSLPLSGSLREGRKGSLAGGGRPVA